MTSLPNILTLCNLFCGCIAVVGIFSENVEWVVVAFGLSLLFDMADGAVARAMGHSSPLGKELDSLADAVSFGFVPGAIAFSILSPDIGNTAAFCGFFLTMASVWRLARFNLDSRQSQGFIGLPTPASATFFVGLYWALQWGQVPNWLSHWLFYVALIILFSYLMNSPWHLIKISSIRLHTPSGKLVLALIACFIPLWYFWGVLSISLSVLLYIVLSLYFINVWPKAVI